MVKIGVKMPTWLRFFNIAVGILYILISGALFYNIALEEVTLLYFLIANLILMGFAKIVNGINYQLVSKAWMIFNIIIGIILIGSSVLVFIFPDWGILALLTIIASSLAVQGLYRVLYAIFNKKISIWATGLNLIVGILTLGLTLFIIFNSELSLLWIIMLVCIVFILNGLLRIISGIRGYVKMDDGKKD